MKIERSVQDGRMVVEFDGRWEAAVFRCLLHFGCECSNRGKRKKMCQMCPSIADRLLMNANSVESELSEEIIAYLYHDNGTVRTPEERSNLEWPGLH